MSGDEGEEVEEESVAGSCESLAIFMDVDRVMLFLVGAGWVTGGGVGDTDEEGEEDEDEEEGGGDCTGGVV